LLLFLTSCSASLVVASIELQVAAPDWAPAPEAHAAPEGSTPDVEVAAEATAPMLTVSERLALGSKHAGVVAINLLHVQDRIDLVEREVLGKVFDMETLRNFLRSHREAVDNSQNLRDNIAAKSEDVEKMTDQLRGIRQRTSEQMAGHLNRTDDLHAKLAKGAAEIERLTTEKELNDRLRALEKTDSDLEKGNKNLRGKDAGEVTATKAAMAKLEALKTELARYQKVVKGLEGQVQTQHTYSAECRQRTEVLRLRLAAEESRLSEERVQLEQLARQRQQAEESLIRNNGLLQGRLVKAKANFATIQTQVLSSKDRHTALQSEAENHLGVLRKALGARRMEADAAEIELAARLNATRDAEQRLERARAEVGRLQGIIIGGRLAEMRHNSTQMKDDLKQARFILEESQAALARASNKLSQANETLSGLREESKNIADDASKAMRESLAQAAAAKRKDDEASRKAEGASAQAEAALLTDCIAIWDEKHKSMHKELAKCEQLKSDLQTKSAQVATLSSTVQVKEAAMKASEAASPSPATVRSIA